MSVDIDNVERQVAWLKKKYDEIRITCATAKQNMEAVKSDMAKLGCTPANYKEKIAALREKIAADEKKLEKEMGRIHAILDEVK